MPKNPSNYSEIRIIGGSLRSRKIVFPIVNELRPTPNRVRETLFNWLAPHIRGARCLDMFAGSGALGFEAISRGAGYCLMLDSSDEIISALKQNQITLKLENISVQKATFPFTLQTITEQFDIIFLDPPFQKDYIGRVTTWLKDSNCLRDNALIYIESENNLDVLPVPDDWTKLKEKTAGNVRYSLFQFER
jgi:16S rRNA (guanine966-N2)-methyltransferase